MCRVIRVAPAEPACGNVSAPARERDDGERLTYDAALGSRSTLGGMEAAMKQHPLVWVQR